MKMKKIVFTVTVLLLVAAFGTSAFLVGSYVLDGKKQADRNDELSNIVAQAQSTAATAPQADQETTAYVEPPAPIPEDATVATVPEELTMLPGYQELYDLNDHTVGWIRIENTKLDNPVLQTPYDKDYYLYRNFDRNSSQHGSIYAWEKADINKPSDNITIFGHNMGDGSMFATLGNYASKETWDNNSLIFFDTLYEYHTYKIFAVFKTSMAEEAKGFQYHRFVDAANQEEFDAFVKQCKDLAFYDTGITPVYGDKLICLSTCEYSDPYGNGRFVVAAVRIT